VLGALRARSPMAPAMHLSPEWVVE
jgi:hypothetical protein